MPWGITVHSHMQQNRCCCLQPSECNAEQWTWAIHNQILIEQTLHLLFCNVLVRAAHLEADSLTFCIPVQTVSSSSLSWMVFTSVPKETHFCIQLHQYQIVGIPLPLVTDFYTGVCSGAHFDTAVSIYRNQSHCLLGPNTHIPVLIVL